MKLNVLPTSQDLGEKAAAYAAEELNKAIEKQGFARLLVSTGASQFETLNSLKEQDVDWTKVEMFHLDEYIGLSESHIASFRKYLQERFVRFIPLKKAHFVNGEGDIDATIKALTEEIRKEPIDVALIGIGENSHIAFNDPPANFDTKEGYIVVDLDDKCKNQQVGEGWFDTIDDVPKQAISMSVYQIMQSKVIISCVPHAVKAQAVKDTLENDLTNMIPATMLKQHSNWSLYLDKESASLIEH